MSDVTKKIKVVIAEKNFHIGGVQRIAINLITRLDREKFEVHLITLKQSPGRKTLYGSVPRDVEISKLYFKGWTSFGEWFKLIRILYRVRPDIVKSSNFFCNSVFKILQPFFRYKEVAAEYNTQLSRSRIHKLLNWILMSRIYTTVGDSKMVAEELARDNHLDRDKLAVIYNGVDLDLVRSTESAYRPQRDAIRNEMGIQQGEKVFLSVARFFKQKNHTLMIEAFHRLAKMRQDCRLVLVGAGGLLENAQAQVRDLHLEERIIFAGEQTDIHRFYVLGDFSILTSLHEGFSIASMEGLAHGLPLVSTRVAGIIEYLEDGKNGFFVDDNPEDIAEKMNTLAEMPRDRLEAMKDYARQTASKYSIDSQVRAYEDLFLKAVRD